MADSRTGSILALGRRPPPVSHPRLQTLQVDFAHLTALPPADHVYIALGTTIQVAGSQAAFRAVDFDAVLAVASAAREAGAARLGVVSAMGADAHSRIFYSRVKGAMEEAVAGLGYDTLVIARPSLLDGDRAALEQPVRMGERVGTAVMAALKPLIPRNYRAIRASQVARSLVQAVQQGRPGTQVLLSGAMQAA